MVVDATDFDRRDGDISARDPSDDDPLDRPCGAFSVETAHVTDAFFAAKYRGSKIERLQGTCHQHASFDKDRNTTPGASGHR